MLVRNIFAFTFFCALVFGCGDGLEDPSAQGVYTDDPWSVQAQQVGFALADGSPEAVGVLGFLNDPATSLRILDVDARLNRRAAQAIVHHRNGPDGIFGSYDDEPFESLAELDAVKWVGPKTIDQLIEYSAHLGWVPTDNQLLGIYDGIAFSVNEAEVLVDFVNGLEFDDLDAFLNARAANALIEGGPYASAWEISEVPFIGRVTLKKLKERSQAASK